MLMLIALFCPWIRFKIGGGFMGVSARGTSGASFGWISILSVLAVFTVVLLTLFDVELPVQTGLVYLGAGGLALLVTLLVIVFRPIGTDGFGLISSKIPWVGSWIGLVAAVGIVVGGFLKFQEQRY